LPLPKGDSSLLGSKNPLFQVDLEYASLLLGELGTCPQNLMPTRGVEP
jgi:hypothetical protein